MPESKLKTLNYKKIVYENQTPKVESSFIAPNCFIIGNVHLKTGSSVWFGSTLRGDTSACQIGENTAVMELCYIENSQIGDNSMISHGGIVHKCEIGNNVLVGIGSRIINGAKIGDNSIIGAGSLILPNSEIPANSVVIGNGKIIRTCTSNDLDYIQRSVQEVLQKALVMAATLKTQIP